VCASYDLFAAVRLIVRGLLRCDDSAAAAMGTPAGARALQDVLRRVQTVLGTPSPLWPTPGQFARLWRAAPLRHLEAAQS
jgi:hypothetical protein